VPSHVLPAAAAATAVDGAAAAALEAHSLHVQGAFNTALSSSSQSAKDLKLDRPDSNSSVGLSRDASLPTSSASVVVGQTSVATAQVQQMLTIVQAQRDRFKERNIQLEAQLSKSTRELGTSRDKIEKLESDNLQLYAKIKYVVGGGGGGKDRSGI
jgi:homeobox protein cut-like